jgi:invasion protein IalB
LARRGKTRENEIKMHQRISAGLFAAALGLAIAPGAFAQTPPAAAPAPAAKPATPKPAAQATPKPAASTPKPAQPAQAQPTVPAQQADQASPPGQAGQPQLMYSPWIKICNKGNEPNAKQVCVTAKDGRLENGMPVAAVALIEPQGEARKLMRITVPLGMQLQHGTRMIIDQDAPSTAPYFMCFPNGCMADYEANADMVARLKKGKSLTVQAINMQGQPISLPLPLSDFAKAYDGAPTDPKVFEEQQRKLQDELQKKAEEARKKLEAAQPQASAPAAPAAPKQ